MKKDIIFKKGGTLLKSMGSTLPVAEAMKTLLKIKEEDQKHQNTVEAKQFEHQSSIEIANGLMTIRKEMHEQLTDEEKLEITKGVVRKLTGS